MDSVSQSLHEVAVWHCNETRCTEDYPFRPMWVLLYIILRCMSIFLRKDAPYLAANTAPPKLETSTCYHVSSCVSWMLIKALGGDSHAECSRFTVTPTTIRRRWNAILSSSVSFYQRSLPEPKYITPNKMIHYTGAVLILHKIMHKLSSKVKGGYSKKYYHLSK